MHIPFSRLTTEFTVTVSAPESAEVTVLVTPIVGDISDV